MRGGALHSVGERVVGNLDTAGRARLGDADKLAFRDQAGRDHMTRFDGKQDDFDAMDEILRSLLDPKGAVSQCRGSKPGVNARVE